MPPQPTAGTKRPHDDGSAADSRRDRPRDWRDEHLSERNGNGRSDRTDSRDYDRSSPRRDYYSRDRSHYDRDHRDDRRRGYDDRGGQRDSREYRDRDRDRVGFPQRGARPRDDQDSRRGGKEEGEIDSPPRSASPQRRRPSPSRVERERERERERVSSPRKSGFPSISVPPAQSRGEPSKAPRPPVPSVFESAAPPASAAPPVEDEPDVVEEEEDEEAKLEAKRKRREAIMAKFRVGEGSKPPLPASVSSPNPDGGLDSVTSAGIATGVNTETGATPLLKQLGTRSVTGAGTPIGHQPSLASTPLGKDFDLEKHGEQGTENKDGVSAADYDQSREDDRRKDPAAKPAPPAEDEWEEVEIEVEEEDDDVDMFAAFGDEEPVKKMRKVKVRRRKVANGDGFIEIIDKPKSNAAAVLEVVDNVDDTEGYYRITPGELMDDGRYELTYTLGKGMFSAVVKAKVLKAVGQERRQDVVGKEVAIKLMRSQESMYVAGRKEAQILKLLNDADPEDKKHIVRMERTFEHKGHLAIVTESLSMNLRDVIKRFGKDVGLNMRAVRAYAHQMLLALSLMRKCNIVHADIKPDNVLVSENKAVLKVCDLGTAADVSEGEVTPYLVSRFYRAPEIILGLPYDFAIDVWAIGCTLFELYTGKILFPGRSNNHMLLLMMEVKGKIPHRMIKKSSLGNMHFDENNNFISIEKDRITGADVVKTLTISKATRDMRSRIMPHSSVQAKMKEDELKQLQAFVDLLDKCLQLDPVRRISPREALLHPFFAGKV
ncbi:U4/U6 small nuclear ribonucleoprotein prp4 [Vanrija albida]|uniref:non-specific serine/threonine protein kinase n=1 Tax=Vanrija albida TaxID=181172 RepID=A0ABR3Q847_9TREE